MEALRASLDFYDADVVRQIALTLELRDADTKPQKNKLIQRLLSEIPRRAGTPEYVKALSETDRAILAVVLEHGGQIACSQLLVTLFSAALLPLPAEGEGPDRAINNLEALLQPLLLRGLLVNLTSPLDYSTRRHLRPLYEVGIPPEVAQVLPRRLLKVPQPDLQSFVTSTPAQVHSGDPETLLRHLFFLWSGLSRVRARRLKSGAVAKADLRRMARELGIDFETQQERLELMLELLQAAGFLTVMNDTFGAQNDEHTQRLWQQDPGTQIREFHNALLKLEGLPNLGSGMQHYLGYGFGQYGCNAFTVLHHQLAGVFQSLLEIPWFPYDVLMLLLNRGKPGGFVLQEPFVRSLEQQLSWSSSNANSSQYLAKMSQEMRDSDNAVAVDLLEDWQWLGLIELGYVAGRSLPQAVRLTPLGRAVLRREAFVFNNDQGQIILQPDFQVLALGPVPLPTLLGIEQIAERETVQQATVGYRLTRQSIYRALQYGNSIGVICAFLTQVTQQPLPQNIERTLEEWGEQHERILVRRDVLVLQTSTVEELDGLLADSQLREWVHRLNAHTAWADHRHAAKIQRRLGQMQWLPALSRGPETDFPGSLCWDEGRLLPRTLPPSLYVAGMVQRFALPEETGWRVTPASIQNAVNTNFSAPEILAQIERLTGAPLSPEWQQRLKAWASHYGQACLVQARLVRLENAEILSELRSTDRQLGRWLHPLADESSVALIDEKNWEAVIARLEELGVSIQEGRWW
ncbi:MAG: helicase-associated domain-containing protein [Anaerolineae bacterium]|jgi:hypothetical protein|nr:helicase-associated domain-containing protein [Anaerolineae bacterium]